MLSFTIHSKDVLKRVEHIPIYSIHIVKQRITPFLMCILNIITLGYVHRTLRSQGLKTIHHTLMVLNHSIVFDRFFSYRLNESTSTRYTKQMKVVNIPNNLTIGEFVYRSTYTFHIHHQDTFHVIHNNCQTFILHSLIQNRIQMTTELDTFIQEYDFEKISPSPFILNIVHTMTSFMIRFVNICREWFHIHIEL